MNKLKAFYRNNRIYVILMAISFFCILLIAGAFIFYFVEQLKNDQYGNRLTGIENIAISDNELAGIKNIFKENDKITDIKVRLQGKIIYIDVSINNGTIQEMQSLAVKSLDALTVDEKDYYDISFGFTKKSDTEDTTFPIMGYKRSSATIISWVKTTEN